MKEPKVYTTKKGEYWYSYLIWYTKDNVRKQKMISTGIAVKEPSSKRRAQELSNKLLEDKKIELSLDNFKDITFANYLTDWLNSVKIGITASTYNSYKTIIVNFAYPYFKQKSINLIDLKTKDIQEFYNWKIEKYGIKAKTLRNYHICIHSALENAVKTDMILKNPADNVMLPKIEKSQAKYYTIDQTIKLLNAVKNTEIEPVVQLAIWFGMRRGEILGLKWDCINYERKTLSILGTLNQNGTYKSSGKTKTSLRTYSLNDEMLNYLKTVKAKQTENKKKLGDEYNMQFEDFVCVRDNGNLLMPDYVTSKLPQICSKYGLPKIKLHELRHTNISLLIDSGATPKEVQEWAGHSSYKTTMDIYAHMFPSKNIELSNKICDMLKK